MAPKKYAKQERPSEIAARFVQRLKELRHEKGWSQLDLARRLGLQKSAARASSADHEWSHERIQGSFPLLARRQKTYPAHMAPDLAWVRSIRELADYHIEMVSSRVARDAVNRASRFVGQVQGEITR